LAAGKAGSFAGKTPSFEVWRKTNDDADLGLQREFRASVARGSDIFFSKSFRNLTCAGCHNSKTTRWMDIGTANTTATHASPDLPVFNVTCSDSRVIDTQATGRALVTGKCDDVGAIVLQQLRGLAARAPYFSNGSAQTLSDVVDYYDRRYEIGYTEKEKKDLL